MNQLTAYRKPTDPGYVGGFYWPPTIVGFIGLFLTNVIATQFVAWRFENQPALGPALLRIGSFSAATAISFAHDRRRTCMTLAHIGGVPLEEMLLPIAAVGGSFLLNGLLGRPRRRQHPPEREDMP